MGIVPCREAERYRSGVSRDAPSRGCIASIGQGIVSRLVLVHDPEKGVLLMKKLPLFLCFLLAPACSDGDAANDSLYDGYVSQVVSVRNLIDHSAGPATVDLREKEIAYQVDQGVDISSVILICPNQQTMNFEQWVAVRSEESGTDLFHSRNGFVVLQGQRAAPQEPTSDNTINCPKFCVPCSDGSCSA